MAPRVHQLLPVFSPHDAMSQAAVGFQWLLRRLGFLGQVHAGEVAPGFQSLVRPLAALRPRADDLVLYHHGIASELAGALLHLPCRRGVVFHNITPARFYRGTSLAEPLTAGRAQLAAMAGAVELSIGVSHFNASELRIAGHANVHAVPLFIEPERFDAEAADPELYRRLRRRWGPAAGGQPRRDARGYETHVVSVCRVVPHKRVEDLLSLHAELRRLDPAARLTVVGPCPTGSRYFRSLRPGSGVTFLGELSHSELVAAYRSADAFVSMSEHEGFGVPLIEAMACEVPVLAYAAAAVPETLDGRGIGFDEKRFAALAELLAKLKRDDGLRERVVDGQRRRVEELSPAATQAALRSALASAGLTADRSTARRHHRAGRPRVALVVQRYGEKITGGAEAHARAVAHHLSAHADVTVLTTTASDHLTWADVLPDGEDRDGRVTVHRFHCGGRREMRAFNRLSDERLSAAQSRVLEEHWLSEQGPRARGLLEHLADHHARYDAFVFFTYLYAPTALGLPLVADKALLVPTAHDEPPLRFHAFADAFQLPRVLLCNTPEEAELIRQRFPGAARARIVGVGVEPLSAGRPAWRPVHEPYLLYVGRLEAGKGLKELVKLHHKVPDAPLLVVAGAGALELRGPRVKMLGRISEQQKYDALRHAVAAVVPSRYESLSLLALEAFSVGAPVIGNAGSEVVKGHLQRSGAGFAFSDASGYVDAVKRAIAERAALSKRASAYARRFKWSKVVEAYLEEIDRIRKA